MLSFRKWHFLRFIEMLDVLAIFSIAFLTAASYWFFGLHLHFAMITLAGLIAGTFYCSFPVLFALICGFFDLDIKIDGCKAKFKQVEALLNKSF